MTDSSNCFIILVDTNLIQSFMINLIHFRENFHISIVFLNHLFGFNIKQLFFQTRL